MKCPGCGKAIYATDNSGRLIERFGPDSGGTHTPALCAAASGVARLVEAARKLMHEVACAEEYPTHEWFDELGNALAAYGKR